MDLFICILNLKERESIVKEVIEGLMDGRVLCNLPDDIKAL